eukprot:gene6250-7247_t
MFSTENLFLPTVLSGVLCVGWLQLTRFVSSSKLLTPSQTRKVVHIGTGLIYVCSWGLYPVHSLYARFYAAVIPSLICLQFSLVGLGILKDAKTVDSMSRSGNPRELLFGPATYGVIFVVSTIVFWGHSCIGITAISLLCFGDGFAGLVGQEMKHTARLPWNKNKTYAGCIAFVVASFFGTITMLTIVKSYGFLMTFSIIRYLPSLLWATMIAAVVESLPIEDWDNITVFMSTDGTNYDFSIKQSTPLLMLMKAYSKKLSVNLEKDGTNYDFSIKQSTPLLMLMKAYSKRLSINLAKVRFEYEGQIIQPDRSASDYGIRSDDQIRVFMQKTTKHSDPTTAASNDSIVDPNSDDPSPVEEEKEKSKEDEPKPVSNQIIIKVRTQINGCGTNYDFSFKQSTPLLMLMKACSKKLNHYRFLFEAESNSWIQDTSIYSYSYEGQRLQPEKTPVDPIFSKENIKGIRKGEGPALPDFSALNIRSTEKKVNTPSSKVNPPTPKDRTPSDKELEDLARLFWSIPNNAINSINNSKHKPEYAANLYVQLRPSPHIYIIRFKLFDVIPAEGDVSFYLCKVGVTHRPDPRDRVKEVIEMNRRLFKNLNDNIDLFEEIVFMMDPRCTEQPEDTEKRLRTSIATPLSTSCAKELGLAVTTEWCTFASTTLRAIHQALPKNNNTTKAFTKTELKVAKPDLPEGYFSTLKRKLQDHLDSYSASLK